MYKGPPPEICSEQFYETDDGARVRARLRDPDRRPAADRLGRARARRRPLGAGAARVHARLQPLVHARHAVRAAAAAREPRHARRREGRARHPGRPHRLHAVRQRPREHRLREGDAAPDLGGRRRAGRPDDRPLRPPRRRLPHGPLAARQRRRRRPPRLGPAEPVRRRRQRDADAGLGQPGADDHGARVAARRAPGRAVACPRRGDA